MRSGGDLGQYSTRGPTDATRYADGIRRAKRLGLISIIGGPAQAPGQELYCHLVPGDAPALILKPTNTRPLCRYAEAIIARLPMDRPRILELGPGAGAGAAQIRRLQPCCTLETVSLTPIDPFHPMNSGEDAPSETPFIDRQHVGEVNSVLPEIESRFNVIYDNFGPIFWQLIEATRTGDLEKAERFIQSVLGLLTRDGVLCVGASEGCLWLEGMLEREAETAGRLVRFPPLFKTTEIRPCIFTKGAGVALRRRWRGQS